MNSTTFVLLSGTLTFGVPLALAIREIMTLPRSRRGGAGRRVGDGVRAGCGGGWLAWLY